MVQKEEFSAAYFKQKKLMGLPHAFSIFKKSVQKVLDRTVYIIIFCFVQIFAFAILPQVRLELGQHVDRVYKKKFPVIHGTKHGSI
jgi:hypothetical protein